MMIINVIIISIIIIIIIIIIIVITSRPSRSRRLHAGNRHLRSHRGSSVAFSNGFSVAFSSGISLVSGIFQRIATGPVDCYWNCPMDVQWHLPTEFHFCDFWCVIFCPERPTGPRPRPGTRPPGARGDLFFKKE